MEITDLLGATLKRIRVMRDADDRQYLLFEDEKGFACKMYHKQNCCESVELVDMPNNFEDLIGSPILVAAVEMNQEEPNGESDESFTWTFYKLATIKGSVTLRWYGTSNGYYSEEVTIEPIRLTKEDNNASTSKNI